MSLLGALGPLGKVAGRRASWLAQTGAYTVGGAVSSALVGGTLGFIGSQIGIALDVALAISLGVTVAVLARELGWLHLPLPHAQRQTNPSWRFHFPPLLTSGLWGFDIGLLFSTWMTFGGAWALVVIAVTTGNLVLGATLLVAFWVGRALSVWLVPLILPSAAATVSFLDTISACRPLEKRIHVAAIGAVVIVLGAWLSQVGVGRVI